MIIDENHPSASSDPLPPPVTVSRFRKLRADQAHLGKGRLYKPRAATRQQKRSLRRPRLTWRRDPSCCPEVRPRAGKYLVMARRERRRLVPTLVMPWKRSRVSVSPLAPG